jgi:hypothetical protein
MRRIHQIISRAAVLAAAGLVAVSLSARTASATTLYTTNGGFDTWNDTVTSDSGTFTNGDVNSPSQGHFGFRGTAPTNGSTAVVNTSSGGSLVVTRNAGDTVLDAPLLNITPSGTTIFDSKVTVTVPTYTTPGTDNGPIFGLDIFGDGGGTNVASLVLDSANGRIYDSVGATTFDLSTGTPPPALAPTFAAGSAVTLEIDATYTAGNNVSLNYLVNGVSYDTETATSASFYDAAIFGSNGYEGAPDTDNGTTDAGNTADFSNYLVTETVVPEPGSLAVLGVGGLLFAFRRNRRAVSL